MSNIGLWLYQKWLGIVFLIGETIIGMIAVYCAVSVVPLPPDADENESLEVTELSRKYLDFSNPDSIDARSELLLIAGDLSFLGTIPRRENKLTDEQWEKCKAKLGSDSATCGCCNTCYSVMDKLMEKANTICMGKQYNFNNYVSFMKKELY